MIEQSPILITGCARSGIYEIKCVGNDKRYIGSSHNILKRFKDHLRDLNGKKHHNRHLQRAWYKYGIKKFELRTLLFCDISDLVFFEQRAIDGFNAIDPKCGYNICPVAESRLGAKFTKEQKLKLSKARKGKYTGEDNHNYGKSMIEETRKKISKSLKGRYSGENSSCYNKKHTEETKKKISIAGKGRVAWNKGLTVETDERVKNNAEQNKNKKKSKETRKKISDTLKGHKITEETRKKLCEAQKKRWAREDERNKQSERLKKSYLRRKSNHD